MINVTYKIYDGTTLDKRWPAIVRQTFNDEILLAEELVDVTEAELSGVSIEEYFTVYKGYISNYLTSLTNYPEESSLEEMDSHSDLQSAAAYFNFFMMPKWRSEG